MGLLLALQANSWPLLAIAASLVVADRVYKYQRLRAFKGPFVAGWTDWWHSWALLSEKAYLHYGRAVEQYGPIARIAPNHLVIGDPEYWARINAVRSPYMRSPWYYHNIRIEPGKDHVVSMCDDKEHEVRRKQLFVGYSGKENANLEATIDERIKELLSLIRNKYISTPDKPVKMDLAQKLQFLTLDVISCVALGKEFGNLRTDSDVDRYCQSCKEGLFVCNLTLALGVAWLFQIPFIGKLFLPSDKDEQGYGKMIGSSRRYVEKRLASPTDERSDMFASFVRHGIKNEDLFQELMEQILAGSDTTASGLRSVMLFLLTNPRVYKKLQAEVDETVKAGKAGPSSAIIPDAEAKQLKYLNAVIREGMRMHPPVANIFSKIVPPQGDAVTVEGKSMFIPGGTLIGYSAWAVHQNEGVFGETARQYWPERWLVEKDKDRLAAMTKTNDMIFGHGKWQCLGKNIAFIELNKVVFELMRNFDWGMVNPERPWISKNIMGLFTQSEMWVQVAQRRADQQ